MINTMEPKQVEEKSLHDTKIKINKDISDAFIQDDHDTVESLAGVIDKHDPTIVVIGALAAAQALAMANGDVEACGKIRDKYLESEYAH